MVAAGTSSSGVLIVGGTAAGVVTTGWFDRILQDESNNPTISKLFNRKVRFPNMAFSIKK
jgi:hypothetical protein